MFVFRSAPTKELPKPIVATIGNFDGVHQGHQAIISMLNQKKGKGSSLIITLYPHPLVTLGQVAKVPNISSIRQKLKLFKTFAVDAVYYMHFTKQLAETSAANFVDKILIDLLKIDHLIIGKDAKVGANGEGDSTFILNRFAELGLNAEIIPEILNDQNNKIGSRSIRELILKGDIKQTNKLLGRHFSLDAKVVKGAGRGTKIGFPTLNLLTHQILPAYGVYATRAIIEGKKNYESVTNVGLRPTFSDINKAVVETHLLDYNGATLYGKRVELVFIERIREEIKFDSVDNLTQQIAADISKARTIL